MNSEVVLAPTSAFIALALRSTQTGRHDSFTGPPTGNCTVTGMLLGPLPQIPQPAQVCVLFVWLSRLPLGLRTCQAATAAAAAAAAAAAFVALAVLNSATD